jgi:Tfp pilus assembly protein PilE
MKLIPVKPSIWNPLGSPFKDVFIVAIIAIIVSVFIVYVKKSSLRLKYKSAEAKQCSDEELNSMKAEDKDGIFKLIAILGLVTLAIIFGILIQNSVKNAWTSDDIYNANKASAISQNTSKLEDYYGISNVQFSKNDDDILITSIGSSDAGLNNNDRKVNDLYKDQELKEKNPTMKTITFTLDGKSYSGLIKKQKNIVNIYRQDGEMLTKSTQSK